MKNNNIIIGIVAGIILTAFCYQVYTIYIFQRVQMNNRENLEVLAENIEQIENILDQSQEQAQAQGQVQPTPVPEESLMMDPEVSFEDLE